MQMIVPILIGVAILVGFVALYMSRENWRVYHMIVGGFLILANVLFLYLAARVLDTHSKWRGEVRKYETAYAEQHEQHRKLTGELDGRGEVIVDRDNKSSLDWSIDDWKAELAEATYGRGRVLTGLIPRGYDEATGVITAATQAGAATLPPGSSVYVFQSQPPRERNLQYKDSQIVITTPPIVDFLGAYIATNVAGPEITLTPLHPERRVKIGGPLVLYEVAPVDTHEAFAHLSEQTIKEVLKSLPPAVVEQYLKDGKPPNPQDANSPHVWRRVRFVKEYTPPVAQGEKPAQPAAPAADATVPGEQAVETEGEVAARPTKFQPGDEAVLDPETAAELVKSGVAEYAPENSYVYRRPLNDYPVAFREVRGQLLATQVKTAELERQIAAMQKSSELAKQTLALRQQEAERLTQDLEKFQFEAQTMRTLHDALVASVKQATEQIESLKQSIGTMAEELVRQQLKAAAAIDRRTGATAAAR